MIGTVQPSVVKLKIPIKKIFCYIVPTVLEDLET